MRQLTLALLVLAVGCDSTRPCKEGTLFVSFQAESSVVADQLRVETSLNAAASKTGTFDFPASGTGSIEIRFPAGYPVGQSLSVTLTALRSGVVVSQSTMSTTLRAGCDSMQLTLRAAGVTPDLAVAADLSSSINDLSSVSDLSTPADLAPAADLTPPVMDLAVSMSWVDPATGTCNGLSTRMGQIASAMGAANRTVTITAKQLAPLANFGDWTATFPNQNCVYQWLSKIAARDVTVDNWTGVCQTADSTGTLYSFVCKDGGSGNPQIAILPSSATPGQYMRLYMIDRPTAYCDLIGVNNRPGFDSQITNTAQFGTAGDSVTFSW